MRGLAGAIGLDEVERNVCRNDAQDNGGVDAVACDVCDQASSLEDERQRVEEEAKKLLERGISAPGNRLVWAVRLKAAASLFRGGALLAAIRGPARSARGGCVAAVGPAPPVYRRKWLSFPAGFLLASSVRITRRKSCGRRMFRPDSAVSPRRIPMVGRRSPAGIPL